MKANFHRLKFPMLLLRSQIVLTPEPWLCGLLGLWEGFSTISLCLIQWNIMKGFREGLFIHYQGTFMPLWIFMNISFRKYICIICLVSSFPSSSVTSFWNSSIRLMVYLPGLIHYQYWILFLLYQKKISSFWDIKGQYKARWLKKTESEPKYQDLNPGMHTTSGASIFSPINGDTTTSYSVRLSWGLKKLTRTAPSTS